MGEFAVSINNVRFYGMIKLIKLATKKINNLLNKYF